MYSNNFKASKLDFKWGNEKSRNWIIDEFAKLRPTSSLVLYLPRAQVLSCLTCSRAVCASYPKCSRASRTLEPMCPRAWRASCLTCDLLYILSWFSFLTCFRYFNSCLIAFMSGVSYVFGVSAIWVFYNLD